MKKKKDKNNLLKAILRFFKEPFLFKDSRTFWTTLYSALKAFSNYSLFIRSFLRNIIWYKPMVIEVNEVLVLNILLINSQYSEVHPTVKSPFQFFVKTVDVFFQRKNWNPIRLFSRYHWIEELQELILLSLVPNHYFLFWKEQMIEHFSLKKQKKW